MAATEPPTQDLNDLYFFVRVLESGGFAAAGRALGIPKSRLSCRIALLEGRLGVRLLQRSMRRLAVTEVGQTYYDHCQAMVSEAGRAGGDRARPGGAARHTHDGLASFARPAGRHCESGQRPGAAIAPCFGQTPSRLLRRAKPSSQ